MSELTREEVEQIVANAIKPLTEEIAKLKAALGLPDKPHVFIERQDPADNAPLSPEEEQAIDKNPEEIKGGGGEEF